MSEFRFHTISENKWIEFHQILFMYYIDKCYHIQDIDYDKIYVGIVTTSSPFLLISNIVMALDECQNFVSTQYL